MNATDVINMMPEGTRQINEFAAQIIGATENGNDDPLAVYKQLNDAIKSLELAKGEIKQLAIDEAEKYGKKFQLHNAEFSHSVRANYDFSNCNDQVYEKISDELNDVKVEKKEREKFLKTVKEPITMVDDETGEVLQINPPAKTYTDVLRVKNLEPELPEPDLNKGKKDLPF